MSSNLAEKTDVPENAVLELHKEFLKKSKPPEIFNSLREAALARFEEIKFPHRKHEMFSFVNTKELAATRFALQKESLVELDSLKNHIYEGCESSLAVFVDGVFREDLSNISALDGKIKITPLDEAITDDSVRQYLLSAIKNENDVFASINSAFLNRGWMLEVPAKATCETPMQVLHVSTGSSTAPVTTHPRLLIKLGAMAELKLIVKYIGLGENYFVNSVTDFILGEDAGLAISQVQADHAASWHFSKLRGDLYRNSRLNVTSACHGSKLTRQHFEVHLKENGAEMRLNGVSVLDGHEQAHNYIRIHHEAPYCTSRQHFKNVINDSGRSSFDGTVVVDKGAQQTNSDQLINNLMLSDDAHADNKPNLMIYADDVKCAHGVTVGQIDEDQLFYLKTRGLSLEVAKALLTKSFAESIVETFPFPAVVESLEQTLLKKLEAKHG